MEGLPILLLVLWLVASVLERVLKPPGKGAPPQAPPQRGRPQVPPQRRETYAQRQRREAQERAEAAGAGRPEPAAFESAPAEGRASDMIPEDLWRVLTGQEPAARREPHSPRPEPQPWEEPDLPGWDEEAVARDPMPPDEEEQFEPARSLEDYRREVVVHEPPVIVSLETAPLPPERRHAAFHQRLAAMQAASVPLPTGPTAAASLRARLRDPGSVREAVILSEVFGRPRGLD